MLLPNKVNSINIAGRSNQKMFNSLPSDISNFCLNGPDQTDHSSYDIKDYNTSKILSH